MLFNGAMSYTSPLNIWELSVNPTLAREFWTNNYQLIHLQKIPDDEIKKKTWLGILEFFMKHIHERNLLKNGRK